MLFKPRVKDVAFTSTLSFLNKALIFTTSILVARMIRPYDWGLLALTFATVALVNGVLSFDFGPAITKFTVDQKGSPDAAWTGIILGGLSTFFVAAVLFTFSNPLATFMGKPIADLLLIATLYILTPFPAWVFVNRLPGIGRIQLGALFGFLYDAFRSVFMFIFIYFQWPFGRTALGALAGTIFGIFLWTVLAVMVAGVKPGKFSPSLARQMFRYTSFLYLGRLLYYITARLDEFMLGFFVLAEALGWYAVAQSFADVITIIPVALTYALFPAYARLYGERAEKVKWLYTMSIVGAILYLIVAVASLSIAAPILFTLTLTHRYIPAIPIFYICIYGSAFSCVLAIGSSFFQAIGKTQVLTKAAIIQAITFIPLLFLLVPIFGVVGAAFVDVVTQFVGMIFYTALALKELKISWRDLIPTRKKINEIRRILLQF